MATCDRQQSMEHTLKKRDMRLDALRGYFLALMAITHVPTPLSHIFQDPLGYNGAAEGFIFLSACLAGMIYGKSYAEGGWSFLLHRMWTRARRIYFVHIGVLLPIVLIAWPLSAKLLPLANHFHDFLVHPWGALLLMPLLMHQPPLFDILPLYVIFFLMTPFMIVVARRYGWWVVLCASGLFWLAVQFKLDAPLVGNPVRLLPFRLGAFDTLAWQFLWVCGIALGETSRRHSVINSPYRLAWAVPALVLVLAGLIMRHGLFPQPWLDPNIFLWFDKWTLGPLRLLNFAAWVVLFLAWRPHPPEWLMAPTAVLGRHSLAVFAMHLPLVIIASTIVQIYVMPDVLQCIIGASVVGLLIVYAAWLDRDRRRAIKMAKMHADVSMKTPLQTIEAAN